MIPPTIAREMMKRLDRYLCSGWPDQRIRKLARRVVRIWLRKQPRKICRPARRWRAEAIAAAILMAVDEHLEYRRQAKLRLLRFDRGSKPCAN